ncbi:hypothetical protein [Robbsia andropogonis]|uniref:hypothetical protein n=1 Tax=Robbsia andropogonis TaxID=28092 RepID=UPI00209D5540|nr:hypothetical protein [Robbsia andropogonis]MCP1117144.1 hypothetical protein [Robbsia andropogonis]MCP1128490.1 hypothetical protein [Robbsia andropogonis]
MRGFDALSGDTPSHLERVIPAREMSRTGAHRGWHQPLSVPGTARLDKANLDAWEMVSPTDPASHDGDNSSPTEATGGDAHATVARAINRTSVIGETPMRASITVDPGMAAAANALFTTEVEATVEGLLQSVVASLAHFDTRPEGDPVAPMGVADQGDAVEYVPPPIEIRVMHAFPDVAQRGHGAHLQAPIARNPVNRISNAPVQDVRSPFEGLDREAFVEEPIAPARIHDFSRPEKGESPLHTRIGREGIYDDLGAVADAVNRGLHRLATSARSAVKWLSRRPGRSEDTATENTNETVAKDTEANIVQPLNRHNLWAAMRGNAALAALRNISAGALLLLWDLIPFSAAPHLPWLTAIFCMCVAVMYAVRHLRHYRVRDTPLKHAVYAGLYALGVGLSVLADRAGTVGKVVGFIVDKVWEMLITCGLTGESGPGNASRRTVLSWCAVIFTTFIGMHYTRAGLFLAIENAHMQAVPWFFSRWAAKTFTEVMAFGGVMPLLQLGGNGIAGASFVYRGARYRWSSFSAFARERMRYMKTMPRHAELYSNLGIDKFLGFSMPQNNGVATWVWPINSLFGALLETEKIHSAMLKRANAASLSISEAPKTEINGNDTTTQNANAAIARMEEGNAHFAIAPGEENRAHRNADISANALPSERMRPDEITRL